MEELVSQLANVIRDLETLKLLEESNITAELKIERDNEYVLSETIIAPEETWRLCLDMFQKIKNRGYGMAVVSTDSENPNNKSHTVEFWKQKLR